MDDISLLPCQVDCFLRSIDTNVIRYVGITFRSSYTKRDAVTRRCDRVLIHRSCEQEATGKENEGRFRVLLETSVLYPESGGQPSDRGFITLLDGNDQVPR